VAAIVAFLLGIGSEADRGRVTDPVDGGRVTDLEDIGVEAIGGGVDGAVQQLQRRGRKR
jgi:hypothetical protein